MLQRGRRPSRRPLSRSPQGDGKGGYVDVSSRRVSEPRGDLPDGRWIRISVNPGMSKYFVFQKYGIECTVRHSASSCRGTYRDRHDT